MKLGDLSQSLPTMKAMAEIKSEHYTKGETGAAVQNQKYESKTKQ